MLLRMSIYCQKLNKGVGWTCPCLECSVTVDFRGILIGFIWKKEKPPSRSCFDYLPVMRGPVGGRGEAWGHRASEKPVKLTTTVLLNMWMLHYAFNSVKRLILVHPHYSGSVFCCLVRRHCCGILHCCPKGKLSGTLGRTREKSFNSINDHVLQSTCQLTHNFWENQSTKD